LDAHVEELIEFKERCKSNTKRIDELELEVKENRELTIAVKEIATEMKHLREEQSNMSKKQESMNQRIEVIEKKPLKEYEETKKQVRNIVIAFVLGIILTALAVALGLKNYL
jgi:DNA repair exonuclease SbcCD ATPase subunit